MLFSKRIDRVKKSYKPEADHDKTQDTPDRAQGISAESAGRNEKGVAQSMGREKIKIDLLIHDLKIPIAVIEAGLTSLLKRPEKYGSVTEKQEKVFKRALRNTKVLQALVNDALELGRAREGIVTYARFKISDIIEQALIEIFDLTYDDISEKIKTCSHLRQFREVLATKNVHLVVDEALWCEEICQDAAKMRQILRNLLNNALKYRRSKVELKVDKKDGAVVFSVSDDGEGIPAVYHKKIFECYFQVNSTETGSVRGHGLGLAGVLVLVEDLGGRMMLDSDRGQGTRFVVEIPLKTC